MPSNCRECGASVPDGGTCRDHFNALLLLEGEIPGVPGSILHFYAVATYGLQHPVSMNFTAEALAGLRKSVVDMLEKRESREGLLRRGRAATNGSVRVTRREGDPAPEWKRGSWPVTIADVCTADTFGSYDTLEEFERRVTAWARSVCDALDRAGA